MLESPILPIPHAYIYANIKLANEGERFDVGLQQGYYSTANMLMSLITTIPGVVQVSNTSLGAVQKESLFMKQVASLSTLELSIWRAGLPAVATRITTGIQTLFSPAFSSQFPVPYQVFGPGALNCITFSIAAGATAKALENAPI